MTISFSSLLDKWLRDPNSSIAAELARVYRIAWASGDIDERRAVLSYIFRARRHDALDLLLASIASDDTYLATHGVSTAIVLLSEHSVEGAPLRIAIEAFIVRFPDWTVLGEKALEIIDKEGATDERS